MGTDAAHDHRVAVGRRLRDGLCSNIPAGAGPVLDDDRLAPCVIELLPYDSRKYIRHTPGRERHDEPDRLRWIDLRGARASRKKQNQRCRARCHSRVSNRPTAHAYSFPSPDPSVLIPALPRTAGTTMRMNMSTVAMM